MPVTPNSLIDPYVSYRFGVEFTPAAGAGNVSITRGGFQSIGGLSMKVGTTDYREGNEGRTVVRKIPGLTTYGNVNFKYGLVTGDEGIYQWLNQIASTEAQGPQGLALMDITIWMYDSKGLPDNGPRWVLKHCFPVGLTMPEMNAASANIAVMNLEVVVNDLTFYPPSAEYSAEANANG